MNKITKATAQYNGPHAPVTLKGMFAGHAFAVTLCGGWHFPAAGQPAVYRVTAYWHGLPKRYHITARQWIAGKKAQYRIKRLLCGAGLLACLANFG